MYGNTHIEHHKSLTKVLERGSQVGNKLKKEKLQVAVPRVMYFGHILTFDGIEPDPEKISVIQDMPACKVELETIFEIINYLSKFSPNLRS